MKRIFHTSLFILAACSGQVRHGLGLSEERVDQRSKSEALRNFEKKLGDLPSNIPKKIEDQIGEIYLIKQFIEEKKYNDAFLRAKRLENTSNRQIRARAAYLKGEILFQQREYDLAMQLLEEVVGRHAFSGMALMALNRLVICAEKLQLAEKKKQYYSILHDFFEAI